MSNSETAGSAMDFVVAELRASPGISFQELKTKAAAHGYVVFPVNYGRAKAMLGLLPVKPAASVEPSQAGTAGSGASRKGRPFSEAGKFVQERLQANPDATLEEVKNIATLSGITVNSGTYYQARSRLGISKAREATRAGRSSAQSVPHSGDTETEQGRATEPPAAPEPKTAPSGAGRSSTSALDIESIALAIRDLEEERNALRTALSRIADIVKQLR